MFLSGSIFSYIWWIRCQYFTTLIIQQVIHNSYNKFTWKRLDSRFYWFSSNKKLIGTWESLGRKQRGTSRVPRSHIHIRVDIKSYKSSFQEDRDYSLSKLNYIKFSILFLLTTKSLLFYSFIFLDQYLPTHSTFCTPNWKNYLR